MQLRTIPIHHPLMLKKNLVNGYKLRFILSTSPPLLHLFFFRLFGPPPLLLLTFLPSYNPLHPLTFSLLHPLLLIPPTLPFSTLLRPLATILLLEMPSAGAPHLRDSPSPLTAWLFHSTLHPTVNPTLKDLQPWVNGSTSSHAPSPFLHYSLSSLASNMALHINPPIGPGLHDALRILLKIVSGIGEGGFQGLPWQALPYIRSIMKERLALAAFSICSCSHITVSRTTNCGSGLPPISGN